MLKIILDEGYKYLLVAIDIPTLNGVIRNDHAFITEPSVNKWKPLTLDQIDQQRELIKKYQKWYNQACVLIHELTPQREEEFKIYYENSSSKEGIIKTLKLENEFIGPVDKQKILENIIYWFTAQREIVSAIKIVLALRESVPIGPFSEEKEQNKSKLTPTQKLKIKNRFNQCEMSGCPNDPYEVHHIRWIEEGGTDTYSNLIVLCANCHKDAHGKNPKGKMIKKDTLKNIVKKRSKSKADEIKAILKK